MQPFDREDDALSGAFDALLRGCVRPLPGEEPACELRGRCLPPESPSGTPGGADVREDAPTARPGRPFRVLAVDDEPNIRRLIEVQLVRCGYQVVLAQDGIEALDAVQRWEPDVVILDVMMPGPDGFEVLRLLKSDPHTAHIPVIMLTAKSGDDHVRHGWRGGVDFYMGKPFNPAELVSVLDRMTASLGDPDAPPPLRRWLK